MEDLPAPTIPSQMISLVVSTVAMLTGRRVLLAVDTGVNELGPIFSVCQYEGYFSSRVIPALAACCIPIRSAW